MRDNILASQDDVKPEKDPISLDTSTLAKVVGDLRSTFMTGKTKTYEYRKQQLSNLLRLYEENNDKIEEALHKDIRKSHLEGYLYEIALMHNDCRCAIRDLKDWMKPHQLHRNWLILADHGEIQRVPYGVVLVMGTWNYPFQLTMVPMCGAIAGGNCVIIKPSELAPHSSKVMAELIPKYLDKDSYRCITGGPDIAEKLLEIKFDYIFYTGSTTIGKKVHQAAAKHLTPVTLELGGKSPVYVDESANMSMVAHRIMWGKCMNMGQTCVAPDYVLCSKKVEIELIREMRLAMNKWYGEDWKQATDLSRIGHKKHFDRLVHFIKTSGKIAMGGDVDESELWIQPTILVDVKETDTVMQEEVFGPILPFCTVESPEEAYKFISARPRPLCLYVFTDRGRVKKMMHNIEAGTVAFNDTIVQFAIDELPFGGVGESGMGYYHGWFSFETFTRKKPVVYRDFSYVSDKLGQLRYPPYNELKICFMTWLLKHWKKFKIFYFDYTWHLICFLFGIGLAFLIQYLNDSN